MSWWPRLMVGTWGTESFDMQRQLQFVYLQRKLNGQGFPIPNTSWGGDLDLSLYIYMYIIIYIYYCCIYNIHIILYYHIIVQWSWKAHACIYPKKPVAIPCAPSHPSLEWVDPHFFGMGYSMSDISMWINMLGRTMYMFDILCCVDVSQPRNYQRFTSKTVELLYTPPWHGDNIAQLSSRFISYVARSKPASRPLADLHTRLRE